MSGAKKPGRPVAEPTTGNLTENPGAEEQKTFSPREIYDLHVATITAYFLNALASAKTELERITLRELMGLVQDLQPKTMAMAEAWSGVPEDAPKRGDWMSVLEMENACIIVMGILHSTSKELGDRIEADGGPIAEQISAGMQYASDDASKELWRCYNWMTDEFRKARG